MRIKIEFTDRGDVIWPCASYGVGPAGELDLYEDDGDGTLYIHETFAPGVWDRVIVLDKEQS